MNEFEWVLCFGSLMVTFEVFWGFLRARWTEGLES